MTCTASVTLLMPSNILRLDSLSNMMSLASARTTCKRRAESGGMGGGSGRQRAEPGPAYGVRPDLWCLGGIGAAQVAPAGDAPRFQKRFALCLTNRCPRFWTHLRLLVGSLVPAIDAAACSAQEGG